MSGSGIESQVALDGFIRVFIHQKIRPRPHRKMSFTGMTDVNRKYKTMGLSGKRSEEIFRSCGQEDSLHLTTSNAHKRENRSKLQISALRKTPHWGTAGWEKASASHLSRKELDLKTTTLLNGEQFKKKKSGREQDTGPRIISRAPQKPAAGNERKLFMFTKVGAFHPAVAI